MKFHYLFLIFITVGLTFFPLSISAYNPEISIAGFFELEGSGRVVFNFNPGWRYFKGDVQNGESPDLDDSGWEIVSTPHTVSLIPAEGSGGKNYQGPVWYRKHFILDKSLKERDGSFRFPAFWGPGFDWAPDHNWGGSGMIGLQEMLIQTIDDKIYLFPAWPEEWDVHFKLHVDKVTTVEVELVDGKLRNLIVSPSNRSKDIVNTIQN
jgi:hypothetical protein